MSTPGHFRMMARYNRAANERLYDAAALLSDDDYRKDRKAFFTSIHGTLNHIMVGDRVWMTRFEGGTAPLGGLDAILYDDFGELRAARIREDDRIDAWVDKVTQAKLDADFESVSSKGVRFIDPLKQLVTHMFNHQTHHRGQVHDMLSQTGMEPPSLDMHRILNPTPAA